MVESLNATNFEEKVKQGISVVDFWAEWCGPCKMMAPIFEQASKELEGKAAFYKVNVDENRDLAVNYAVSAIPTIVILKDGEEKDRIVGSVAAEQLKQAVENI